MENASKALIIAGAILIAIVLITLGVVILQQGDSTTGAGQTALDSREIESFNSKFTKYEGSQTGTNVRALINAARSTTAAENNNGSGHAVNVYKGATGTTALTANDVKPAGKYTVTANYDGNTGYITSLNVDGTFN